MKKLLSLLLTIIMVLSVVTVFAESKPLISIDSVEAKRGETVKVNINIKNNPGFAVLKLKLNFDKNVLIPVSNGAGEVLEDTGIFSNLTQAENKEELDFVTFLAFRTENFTKDGILFTAEFKIKDTASKNASLKLSYGDRDCANQKFEKVSFELISGEIKVTDAVSAPSPSPQDKEEIKTPEDPNRVSVTVDGKELTFDQEPVIINDRTLVPMRAIFEAVDAEVSWEQETRTATGIKNGVTIKFQIENNIMKKNGEDIILDSPAKLINSRTLVPVRAIIEAFGYKVEWVEGKRLVKITTR